MNDNDTLEQLRIVFVEAMLECMGNDDDLTQMKRCARIGLEKDIEGLTFDQLDKLMVELIELNGEAQHEENL